MNGRTDRIVTVIIALALAAGGAGSIALPAAANENATLEAVSPRILFAVSGGYWETVTDNAENDDRASRGYYRAIAYRSEDNTSRLHVQRIALTDAGPEIVTTMEVEAIAQTRGYITDLRAENSTGLASTPGFAAFVFLKRDPHDTQPQTWELFVDEFGDMTIDRASN